VPHAVGPGFPFQPAFPPIRRCRSLKGISEDRGHEEGLSGFPQEGVILRARKQRKV